jgi:hypothetical protein
MLRRGRIEERADHRRTGLTAAMATVREHYEEVLS